MSQKTRARDDRRWCPPHSHRENPRSMRGGSQPSAVARLSSRSHEPRHRRRIRRARPARLEAAHLRAVRGDPRRRRPPRGVAAVVRRARRAVPRASAVAGRRGRSRALPGCALRAVPAGAGDRRRARALRCPAGGRRHQHRHADPLPGVRRRPLPAGRRALLAARVLARGLRRRAVPALRRRHHGDTTYGGGRYLLDTVKGSDLGEADGGIVLDFNFAYNPSCAYDPRWTCPLSPLDSRLAIPVDAGELLPPA